MASLATIGMVKSGVKLIFSRMGRARGLHLEYVKRRVVEQQCSINPVTLVFRPST